MHDPGKEMQNRFLTPKLEDQHQSHPEFHGKEELDVFSNSLEIRAKGQQGGEDHKFWLCTFDMLEEFDNESTKYLGLKPDKGSS